jgi:hypothetical protein
MIASGANKVEENGKKKRNLRRRNATVYLPLPQATL